MTFYSGKFMKAKSRWKFTLVLLLGGLVSAQAAMNIEWGTPLMNDPLYDSYGDPMTDDFIWQLGVFADNAGNQVDPNSIDPASWADYWVIFDQADFDTTSPFSPAVLGSATIQNDGTSSSSYAPASFDFSGMDAYVWAFKTDQDYKWGLEWLIYRSEDWTMPTDPTTPPDPEAEWINVDLAQTDIPLWGNQNGVIDADTGNLSYASNPQLYQPIDNDLLQSYTVIPEAKTYVAGALLLMLGAFHLWSKKRQIVLA